MIRLYVAVGAISGVLAALLVHLFPMEKPAEQPVVAQVKPKEVAKKEEEKPRVKCTAPKFKLGDVVTTVLEDPGTNRPWKGQVVQVYEDVSDKNGLCVYAVMHVNGEGYFVPYDYYEVEIR